MYLNITKENNDSVIIIPKKVDETAINNIGDAMAASFIANAEQLEMVLAMFGAQTIHRLLTIISEFFLKRFKNSKLRISDIENLNFDTLAYEFIKETGFEKPTFNSEAERQIAIDVFCKLGRLYLHKVLFPELILINPNLAYSTLNLLKRTITTIAVIEGFDKKVAFEKLMLDEIEIPIAKILPEQKRIKIKDKHKVIKANYLIPFTAEESDLNKIAEALYYYNAISKKSAFVAILTSNGQDFEPMEIDSKHEKLIAHLFYRMYNPYNKNHKKLIKMNSSKGYMEFLHQNIITESGNTTSTITRKLSSKVMTEPGHDEIINDVKKILEPIYSRQNNIKN